MAYGRISALTQAYIFGEAGAVLGPRLACASLSSREAWPIPARQRHFLWS